MSGQIDTHDRPLRQLRRGAMRYSIDCAATPRVIPASLSRTSTARFLTSTPLACRFFSVKMAQEPTYRWVAGRLLSLASSMIAQPARSVPSLALRRAGLPSCASQQKSDGHQLPCGGPLPEHGTTTLNYFESKQATGYAAFGSRIAEGA